MQKLLPSSRRPDISFDRSGTIRVTARVARILSLQPNDLINIIRHGPASAPQAASLCEVTGPQAASLCEEYLIYASRSDHPLARHHARVHPTKPRSHNYCAHSATLCRALLDALGISAQRVAFTLGSPISIHNRILIPIITKNPILL